MGYPFSKKYVYLAQELIRELNIRKIQLKFSDPERGTIETRIVFLNKFIDYKVRIEREIVYLQSDAYSIGDAIGALADDALYATWKKLSLEDCVNGVLLFESLIKIEAALIDVKNKILAEKIPQIKFPK